MFEKFNDAIRAAGLTPPSEIVSDGRIHRFGPKKAYWYKAHADGVPAGAFGDWRTGTSETWHANIGRELTDAERKQYHDRMDAIRRERKAEEASRYAKAAEKAAETWEPLAPAVDHPYLQAKGINPYGVRQSGTALVIPMRDVSGTLHSLQFIQPDGAKRFLTGGRVAGCFHVVGNIDDADTVCVAEGFATAATIYEATGYPVVVAFNAGNLLPVARAIHESQPGAHLYICADDDYRTTGNPGLTKATEAADAVGGTVVLPQFGDNRPEKATDLNDLHRFAGLGAVRAMFSESDLNVSGVTGVTGVTGLNSKVNSGYTDENSSVTGVTGDASPLSDSALNVSGVTGVTGDTALNDKENIGIPKENAEDTGDTGDVSPFPKAGERPCYRVYEKGRLRHGVYCHGIKHGREGTPPQLTDSWICGPLWVTADLADGHDSNYGLLLQFKNRRAKRREWAMPLHLLKGSCEELRGELLNMGLEIDPNNRNLLPAYLQSRKPAKRLVSAVNVGWHGKAFVLPHRVIGGNGDVRFQAEYADRHEYATRGTLDGWRDKIARYCVGNPNLGFSISAAFAGPLLSPCHMNGGGFHGFGESSVGKSTGLKSAASVWGGPEFMRSWRATGNGLEGAATLLNDGLLCLDEIGEADRHDLGRVVYAIANGIGKQRANRYGAARALNRWTVLALSTGEKTFEATLAEKGEAPRAGQMIRLLNVEITGQHGAFDDLHDKPNGRALSDHLQAAVTEHYGTAGIAFLERLTADTRDLPAALDAEFQRLCTDDLSPQEGRAARRFALVAMAGELATEFGVTGWPSGTAREAARVMFERWREHHDAPTVETDQILRAVSDFIDRHGDSRFSAITDDRTVINRAGYFRTNAASEREYLFNASGMREALHGHDFKRGLATLAAEGWLLGGTSDGKRATQVKVSGRNQKLYAVGIPGIPSKKRGDTDKTHTEQAGNPGIPGIPKKNGSGVRV